MLGTVKGAQTVSDVLNGNAAKLTLTGGNNNGVLNGDRDSSHTGSTLTVSTTVPVTIDHLTITGGYYPCDGDSGDGGGINIQAGTVKLASGAKITGNEARRGGGVYVKGGANLFMYGTALIGDSPNKAIVASDSSTGRANKAQFGGGIYSEGGTIYMGYSAVGTPAPIDSGYGIKRNYGLWYGGGVCTKGTMYLASGEISYNYVYKIVIDGDTKNGQGGGIRLDLHGSLDMTGGMIKGNQSYANGGGIYLGNSDTYPPTLTVSGGTIESNIAGNNGGAIYAARQFSMSGSAYIPYGGSASSNDVYLNGNDVGMTLTDLTPPSSCSNGVVATVYPSSYSISRTIITNSAGYTYAPSLAVVPQSSQAWAVSSATGKLEKVTSLNANNILTVNISSGVNRFVADSSITYNRLTSFLNRNDIPSDATISLDLSGTTLTAIPVIDKPQITSITLPNKYQDATDFCNALWGNRTLTEVKISGANSVFATENGILYRKNSSTGKKEALIYYPSAKSGTSYTLPSDVTSLAARCFMFNQNLDTITNLIQIKKFENDGNGNHFRACKNLKVINLSNVTTVDSISFGSFANCESLETIILSSAFTSMTGGWFNNCPKLKGVHLKSTTPLTIVGYINDDNKPFNLHDSSLKIYVPSSAKSAYLNATSGFASPTYNGVAGSLSSRLVGE